MKVCTVLVGPPGSGKSTFSKRYCKETGVTYINQDSQNKDHLTLFQTALHEGRDVVIDRMNFSKDQRKRYLGQAQEEGYHTRILVFHESRKTCMERCAKRTDHETIKDLETANKAINFFFSKYERPTEDEADEVKFRYPEGEKPEVVVADLDGTLCNVDHRLHFVRTVPGVKKNWAAFFDNLSDDGINQWCLDILIGMENRGVKPIFCSGRPDNHREKTLKWLWEKCGYENPTLYMRPRNDQRDDSVIKEIILDFEILTRFKPYFMIDDRKRVFEMWRRRGFTCLACANGEF